ncbi:MAG: hypothetical protein KDI29_03105 [Pseudomonadales bacterium]|nr:hypothetical protein [Pseudomonadales bacterium]
MIAGILIGIACLWGISMWQGISARQLLNLFLGSFVFILAIMLAAVILIVVIKAATRLVRTARGGREDDTEPPG